MFVYETCQTTPHHTTILPGSQYLLLLDDLGHTLLHSLPDNCRQDDLHLIKETSNIRLSLSVTVYFLVEDEEVWIILIYLCLLGR